MIETWGLVKIIQNTFPYTHHESHVLCLMMPYTTLTRCSPSALHLQNHELKQTSFRPKKKKKMKEETKFNRLRDRQKTHYLHQ